MMPLLLALTLAFAILAWLDLHKALTLLVALLPSYLLRTEIFGIPTTLLELLMVTLTIVWFLKRKPSLSSLFPIHSSMFAVLLLLLAASISIFTSPDPTAALGVWKAYFVEPIILFFILRYELRAGRLSPHTLFQALGISAMILSSIAIIQWITGHGIPIPWDIERRVTSVFEYPNAVGLFLGPIAVIASLQKKVFWFVIAIFSFLAMVLAQSEAAIVSVVATWFIAGFWNRPTRKKTALSLLAVIIAIAISPWRGFAIEKLTLQDYSGKVRISQWEETIDMLGDHWLFGAGLSGYPIVFEPYHQATHIEIFQYPHNIVLNIWVELGLLGVLAFLLLTYQILMSLQATKGSAAISWIALSALWPPRNDTIWIVFLALLQMTIHGLVDVPYFKNDLAILTWILLAIIFAYVPAIDTHQKKKE